MILSRVILLKSGKCHRKRPPIVVSSLGLTQWSLPCSLMSQRGNNKQHWTWLCGSTSFHIIALPLLTTEGSIGIILRSPKLLHKRDRLKWQEVLSGSYFRTGFPRWNFFHNTIFTEEKKESKIQASLNDFM